MAIKYIPDGYHTVTPYLIVKDARRLIEFLKSAFEAQDTGEVFTDPDGKIRHAELRVGDSVIMLSDSNEKYPASTTMLYVYVPDTDSTYRRALSAGGISVMEPANQFYGDRNAGVQDPVGNNWWIATHIEDVSPEEMERRMAAMSSQK